MTEAEAASDVPLVADPRAAGLLLQLLDSLRGCPGRGLPFKAIATGLAMRGHPVADGAGRDAEEGGDVLPGLSLVNPGDGQPASGLQIGG